MSGIGDKCSVSDVEMNGRIERNANTSRRVDRVLTRRGLSEQSKLIPHY